MRDAAEPGAWYSPRVMRPLALLVVIALAACGDDAAPEDAGAFDAGHPEAGRPDAGPPTGDASPPTEDAAPPDDAGPPPGDAGPPTGDAGPSTGDAGASGFEAIVDEALFDVLFLHRGTAPCQGAFYTWEALAAAARRHPSFASEGPDEVRRREFAAFLANIAHETTGGWDTAPDGRYSWGLCWIREGGAGPEPVADYCAPSAEWPCAPGKKYYGRGPMQLSWNYNYGQAGEALGEPLLSTPERVESDPELAFATALWFWMTPQPPKPSAHDVMVGAWTPSAADLEAGRRPGFGMTINIINGGLECGFPTPPAVDDRLGYYARFTEALGTTPGEHTTCADMRPY